MPKLLQINVCSNTLSTGRICEGIAKVAKAHGWDCYVAYGRMGTPGSSHPLKFESYLSVIEHYIESKLFDNEGLASRIATKRLVRKIKAINPDVIQLHNIHDHYLNYPILFDYLASSGTPVVWTQHDCWAFTAGCMYPDLEGCDAWKTGCQTCPRKHDNLSKKASYFSKVRNLHLVPVSDWLHEMIGASALSAYRSSTIHNGINTDLFAPHAKSESHQRFTILGVAAKWDKRKGLDDFVKLYHLLPSSDYQIELVGLDRSQIQNIPEDINALPRTNDAGELSRLYAAADVFVNLTYSDNFPSTNIEALSCGTPVITYATGGSPEAIDEKTGRSVRQGDVEGVAEAIKSMRENPLNREDCRTRALENFDQRVCFESYISLYSRLLEDK